jgi:chorismate-pyruvate lyase
MDVLVSTLDDTASAMWLPGHALNCYVGDTRLRSWLLTPGLLTQRFREQCGAGYSMRRLPEQTQGAERWREVELRCGAAVWVFARSRFPLALLQAAPWLAEIGDTPLGEAISAHGGAEKSEFEYAEIAADRDIVAAALRCAGLAPRPLWVRRSTFRLLAGEFYLQEVFLPDVGLAS